MDLSPPYRYTLSMDKLRQISKEILSQLPSLEGKKILIFGDVGIDEYVQGYVGRIITESPVHVL